MKKLLLFTCCWIFCIHPSFGQDDKFIRIKSDEDQGKVVPFAIKYRFDKFQTGTVSFFSRKSVKARLNYNILLGEMQFIDLKGDTMSLDQENTIKTIEIGSASFFYDTHYGFIEAIARQPDITLAKKETIKPASVEKLSAYDQSSSVSSIDSYSSYTSGNGSYNKLKLKGDIVLAKNTTYFLIDKNNRIRKASKPGILKIFPRKKEAIANYIEEESIDFDEEPDLIKLIQFCNTLTY